MVAKILCVEDEELLLADIEEELQEGGYQTLSARNGKEAIEILKEKKVDLVLCDIMMPMINGLTTLKLIRERLPQHDETPFIFLTAKATREDILMGRKLGADDYLTKPIDYDILLTTIETRLKQVERIRQTGKERLKQIYSELESRGHDKGPLKVALVADSQKFTRPIEGALNNLGCEVDFYHEGNLTKARQLIKNYDLCFLLYSKVVHFYLSELVKAEGKQGHANSILLFKEKVDGNLKNGLRELGISGTIDYPFPPVQIFKTILKAAQTR